MKRLLFILALILPPSVSAATFYLSPTGSDSNPGTSSSPWLSPNHTLNCGDTIIATASTSYSYTNFGAGNFGQVICAVGNNVAWLKCATFDGCKITVPAVAQQLTGIFLNQSYWGVQGWEVSNLSNNGLSTGGCFDYASAAHHIIWANDIANQCGGGGFGYGEYSIVVGNICYKAAQANLNGASCFDSFAPLSLDALPGTHVFVAGNFALSTQQPSPSSCIGYECYDGEGFITDTYRGTPSTNPPIPPFVGTVVWEYNMAIGNASNGFLPEYNSLGDYGNSQSGISKSIVLQNTAWGNSQGGGDLGGTYECGEFRVYNISNVSLTKNIGVTTSDLCYGNGGGYKNDPYLFEDVESSDTLNNNWGYSPYGNALVSTNNAARGQTGTAASNPFVAGTNTNADPQFAAPSIPGAPNCSGKVNVVDCMSTVIANFKPTNAAAVSYGYQAPGTQPKSDPLLPGWYCRVTGMPQGLIPSGCLVFPSSFPIFL